MVSYRYFLRFANPTWVLGFEGKGTTENDKSSGIKSSGCSQKFESGLKTIDVGQLSSNETPFFCEKLEIFLTGINAYLAVN
jgi:hypothetical protein